MIIKRKKVCKPIKKAVRKTRKTNGKWATFNEMWDSFKHNIRDDQRENKAYRWTCKICGKHFWESSTMLRHMRTQHADK